MVDSKPVIEANVVDDSEVAEELGALSVAADVSSAIAGLNNPNADFFTSIKGADWDARKAITAAMTSSEPIDEHIGETLSLVHVIVSKVELADDDTGEINEAPRVVLITEDGKAYHATSVGLLSAVRNLFTTLGEPDSWPAALDIKVVQQKGRRGFKFFTINLV